MIQKPTYPLEQVLEVKRKRVEDAERLVKEKKKALEQEERKLRKLEEERDKVLQHKDDKLAQLRQELDQGTTSTEIKRMKRYLEVVKERLVKEEEKVAEQEKQVEQARKNLEEAKEILRKRRLEVDKLETHQKEWEKEAHKELRRQEAKVEQELGSVMHLSKKRQKR